MPTTYGRSAFFEVPDGQSYAVEAISLSTIPAVQTVSLLATVPTGVLTSVGATGQLSVAATFSDGSVGDVTARSLGSTYASSNPAIATVDQEGLVSAVADGMAFITVRNEGATAVAQVDVSLGDPLTTVIGFVRDEAGRPVAGAAVTLDGVLGSAVSDASGMFQIGGVASLQGSFRACASVTTPLGLLTGCGPQSEPVGGGLTDAGVVVVSPLVAAWVSTAGAVEMVDTERRIVLSSVAMSSGPGVLTTNRDGTMGAVGTLRPAGVQFFAIAGTTATMRSFWALPEGLPTDIEVTDSGMAVVATQDPAGLGSSAGHMYVVDVRSATLVSDLDFPGTTPRSIDLTSDDGLVVVGEEALGFAADAIATLRLDGAGTLSPTGFQVTLLGLSEPRVELTTNDATIAVATGGELITCSLAPSGQVGLVSVLNPPTFGGVARLTLKDAGQVGFAFDNGGFSANPAIREFVLDAASAASWTGRAISLPGFVRESDLVLAGADESIAFPERDDLLIYDSTQLAFQGAVQLAGQSQSATRVGR